MSNELIREMVEALETCKSTPLNMVGSNDGGRHLSHDHNKTSAALAKARAYPETGGWTRVEDGLPEPCVPKNVCIERDGKRSVVRAAYAAPKTLEMNMECDGGEYDEETDTYWCEEGWYEWNDQEEIHWQISDRVIAWHDLPEPPKG